MKKLTGLWLAPKPTSEGVEYFIGIAQNGKKYLLFPNTSKEAGSNSPDFKLYVDVAQPQE